MTIAAILLLQRSRLKTFAFILAVVSAAIVAAVLGQPSIALLGGVGELPSNLPSLVFPDFSAIPQLLLPALALAIVGLAVAAGVSQSYPEPDGSIPNASRDFVGQGAAEPGGQFFSGHARRRIILTHRRQRQCWSQKTPGQCLLRRDSRRCPRHDWEAGEVFPMAALAGLWSNALNDHLRGTSPPTGSGSAMRASCRQ
jgi:hypothetical protein